MASNIVFKWENRIIPLHVNRPLPTETRMIKLKYHYRVSATFNRFYNGYNFKNLRFLMQSIKREIISKLYYLENLEQEDIYRHLQLWIQVFDKHLRIIVSFANVNAKIELLNEIKSIYCVNQTIVFENARDFKFMPYELKWYPIVRQVYKYRKCKESVEERSSSEYRNVKDWSINDVRKWLENIGESEYVIKKFEDHKMYGEALLGLNEDYLTNWIGIKENENVKKILNEIEKLKQ